LKLLISRAQEFAVFLRRKQVDALSPRPQGDKKKVTESFRKNGQFA
jgi:hypothetical protein